MSSEFPDFKIESFKLSHISDNYYEGVLRTNEYGEVYTYYVDVVLYENDYFEWEIRETETYNSNSTYEDNPHDYEINQSSNQSLKEYLTQNTFYLNGNASVTFTFSSYSNQGTIRISGGRANLQGQCEIINDVIYIENLIAVSGIFDASNNSGSFGSLYLSNDGSLNGSLQDKNGNTRNIQLTIK